VDDDPGPLRTDDKIFMQERHDGHSNVIAVAGEIDLVTAPALGAALARALGPAGPGPVVVLDLSRVAYTTAIGISTLVQANALASEHNRRLRLVVNRARPGVTGPLAATGTHILIDTYDDLDNAIDSGSRTSTQAPGEPGRTPEPGPKSDRKRPDRKHRLRRLRAPCRRHRTGSGRTTTPRARPSASSSHNHHGVPRRLVGACGPRPGGMRPRRPHRPDDQRLPPTARHLEVEQDRAPAVLPHLHELARATVDQPQRHVQTIAATITRTGLSVHAELDTDAYPAGVKIPDRDMKALATSGVLARHDFHGRMELHPASPPTTRPRR
jgi:anti-anti-sigma factor